MPSARAQLVTMITDGLPVGSTAVVIPYARNIDPPLKPTVMVQLTAVRQSERATGCLDFNFTLILIAPQTISGPADDELEALVLDVLTALEGLTPAVVWNGPAEAAAYPADNPTNPAFNVACTVTVNKE